MSEQRTHSVITSDGVTIAGTVHGQGRPLVFLQGMMGDGDLDWDLLLEHLTGRFTCYLPSLRGRGLSGDHGDLSPRGRRQPAGACGPHTSRAGPPPSRDRATAME